MSEDKPALEIDAIDREIMRATAGGLPLVSRPYHAVGDAIGVGGDEVMQRMQRLHQHGVIRRVAAIPNHFALGYRANGMSVWDVADEQVDELGHEVGALPFVSHCYRRPRHPPLWPYNLFAMLHGKSREEIEEKLAIIAAVLGEACRAREVLYSTRMLKKTGVRFLNRG
jgi:DNA-binding Lrp family transcriptional regulator